MLQCQGVDTLASSTVINLVTLRMVLHKYGVTLMKYNPDIMKFGSPETQRLF